MKNILTDKVSKKIKLITLSSLFTGLAVASTTVLAYKDVVLENALSAAKAIVVQAEHKH